MKLLTLTSLSLALLFSGCGSGSSGSESTSVTKADLGKRLFFDANLSLNKSMSCSTCHNPDTAFIDARFQEPSHGNPVDGALSLGDDGLSLGGRNAPSVAYAMFSPTFGQNSDGDYVGGQFHDGRSQDLKAQAKGPFLDAAEMMMPDDASVIERVKENPQYVADITALYGDILDDVNASYHAITEAIATFEKDEETFATFDSKYDKYLKKEYSMSIQEELGYSLFFSNNNTNCATCHTLNSESEASERELFSNYEYENIGTPPNMANFIAKGIAYSPDLGLGGRDDINDSAHYGKYKVPTLRNVAVTGPYMTNGVFKNLRTVIEFYDHLAGNSDHPINPETGEAWEEPKVPETVNHEVLQDTKALTDDKIDAIVAFLKLLTDERYEHLIAED
ncbi:MAG: cytochrome c peroxidase [Campylobacterota bacterium]|nr:cytochrome c peroxidase [Campylobacterota bacterium]